MKKKGNSGLIHGYRSGLEEQIAQQIKDAGLQVDYETTKLKFIRPARLSKYTPDFILPNGIVIETKGRFITDDRQKHLIIQEAHPDVDIRFVFSNSRTRISKKSQTTYAMWCNKHGFQFADKWIPEEWINEPVCQRRLEAIKKATL